MKTKFKVLLSALVILSAPQSYGMFTAAKPKLDDLVRPKLEDSITECFRETTKRFPEKHEESQFRAIRERVLLQIIFNHEHIASKRLDEFVSNVLTLALVHVFIKGKSIQEFSYNARTAPDTDHRRH